MVLQSLFLQNFRNYQEKKFNFEEQATLIVGPNASGKTNMLEAIYLLARGKSFRADLDREMIGDRKELARVEGEISEGTRDHSLKSLLQGQQGAHDTFLVSSRRDTKCQVSHNLTGPNAHMTKNGHFAPSFTLEVILTSGEVQGKRTAGKIFKVNGINRRWRDFVGNLKVVLFRPEDIEIVLGSPSVRREYLDSVLEQVDPLYRQCHLVYQKGLRQRNRLLAKIREKEAQFSQLEYWNRLLVKNGEILSQKREELLEFFNEQWQERKNNWFEGLQLEYDKSPITFERLEKYHQAEVALAATLIGPHRDEIVIKIKNKRERKLSLFGSRGEQRMAILALKIAELAFIEQKTGKKPLLLLDDIFSELDQNHRLKILSLIHLQPTILTTTDLDLIPSKFLVKMRQIDLNKDED